MELVDINRFYELNKSTIESWDIYRSRLIKRSISLSKYLDTLVWTKNHVGRVYRVKLGHRSLTKLGVGDNDP